MLTENMLSLLNSIYSQDEYRHVYCQKISELEQNSLNDDEKKVLELFWKVQHLHLRPEDIARPYGPMAEFANGSTTFCIDEFSADDLIILGSLELELLPPILQGRISDILWILTKDYKMGEHACLTYTSLGKQYLTKSDDFFHGIEYIERAMNISRQLGKKNPVHKKWFDETEKILKEISVENITWAPNKLIQLLLTPDYREYCLESSKELYINILNKQIYCWSISYTHMELLEDAFETIRYIYKGKNGRIKEYDLKLAAIYREYVNQYDDNNPNMVSQAIGMLNSARRIYQNHKMVEEEREVIEAGKPWKYKRRSFMVPISNSVDISSFAGEFRPIIETLNKEEKIDFLSIMTRFYDKKECIKRVENKKRRYPFADLFTEQWLDNNGETEIQMPPISDGAEAVKLHAYRDTAQYDMPFAAHYLSIIIQDMNNEIWEENDFSFLLNDNWMIPTDVIDSLKKGLLLGISGKVNDAAPYFLSSIEPIVRNYIEVCGGITTLLREDGTTELKTLGSLLKDEQFVNKCDENIHFTLDAFFNSKAGSNVKNNFSHGRNNWQNNTVANTYLLCVVLKLCYIGSLEGCLRIIEFQKKPRFIEATKVWAKKLHSETIKETETTQLLPPNSNT